MIITKSTISSSLSCLMTEATSRGDDDLSTTAMSLATTLTSSTPSVIMINCANSYVDSLSTEELAEFDRCLKLKEQEFMDNDFTTVATAIDNSNKNVTVQNQVVDIPSKAKVYKKV